MLNRIVYALCLLIALTGAPVFAANGSYQNALNLNWIDLIPENERNIAPPPRPLVNHDGEAPKQLKFGTVRQDLDGKLITIPGFVIPLEGDDKKVTEFLLVPFLGACIHVPPPPPNQIVYVKYEGGAPVNGLWDLVTITGIMHTDGVSSDLGDSGYLLQGTGIEKYVPQD